MAGKASISLDQYKEAFKELTALHKKSPTVKDLQRKLGGGSTELLGKYRATLLLEEEIAPQALTMKPTLAKAIQAEMDDVRNLAVAALNETLRVEREECKTDFERIEIQNEERERAHAEAMEKERDQTRRAIILVEERGLEIDRLRVECTQHQEARRVAELEREKAVAVSEAELAGIERERKANEVTSADLKADLKAEREARHQSEREHAASREDVAVLEQNMEKERDQTRRAIILVEERGLEIDRLRVECTQHQEARRVAELEREKAVAVSEAELAGIERERKANEVTSADLKAEREARHQSEREHAASREGIVVLEQKNHFLQLETQRLQKCEEAAAELPTLRAVNQVQCDQINDLKDAAKVMSDLERSQQGEIHQLRKDLNLLQRQKDEYKGRAEVAENMHLAMLNGEGAEKT